MRVVFGVLATLICVPLIGAGLIRAAEEPGPGLGMAAVFAFLLGLAWFVSIGGGKRKRMRRALRALAEELGASVRKAPHETILDFQVGGQPVTMAWGFVKWRKRRIMSDSLRFEIVLPPGAPRFRLFNPDALKLVLKKFPNEHRIPLPPELEREIYAASPEPDRVVEKVPRALFETAAHLFYRSAWAKNPVHGDLTGWELWCDGARAGALLPNRWDMERVRATLRLLSILVECCRAVSGSRAG